MLANVTAQPRGKAWCFHPVPSRPRTSRRWQDACFHSACDMIGWFVVSQKENTSYMTLHKACHYLERDIAVEFYKLMYLAPQSQCHLVPLQWKQGRHLQSLAAHTKTIQRYVKGCSMVYVFDFGVHCPFDAWNYFFHEKNKICNF